MGSQSDKDAQDRANKVAQQNADLAQQQLQLQKDAEARAKKQEDEAAILKAEQDKIKDEQKKKEQLAQKDANQRQIDALRARTGGSLLDYQNPISMG